MKKISIKNLNGVEILSKNELIKVEGGQAAPYQCELMNGIIVDCNSSSASSCIDILENAGMDVGGCWATTPLPDIVS